MSEMPPEQLRLFRRAILKVLDANPSKFGLTDKSIAVSLSGFGFYPEIAQVDRELNYLAGDPLKYVQIVDAGEFSPEVRSWKITTRGMNFIAQETNG